MKNLLVVIPAIKKNAVIPDQLIKKLNGKTLIQRAIDTACKLTTRDNIFVVTDSEEISLICERNKIKYHKESKLSIDSENILQTIYNIIKEHPQENILLYRANTPLVDHTILLKAYEIYLKDSGFILTSVKNKRRKLLKLKQDVLVKVKQFNYYEELKAFHIFSKSSMEKDIQKYKPFVIDGEKSIEIENYQDWWVCEKILQRKRIVFNVIGNKEIGMGHIYHSLALAHEITDHEIIFVCDEEYKIAVDKIASMDYRVVSTNDTLQTIINLKPNLVINDILDTTKDYILELKKHHIKIVNFEDLGSGSIYADLVFNELYDIPQKEGDNFLWGHEYLALRDEFDEATPHAILEDIKEVMITFGGTDQNNLTLITLKAICDICEKYNIKINIVCGRAYVFKDKLKNFLKHNDNKNIELFINSGIISKIMERSQLAISSNGRTVYELADMNIPSIIISHHKREATHKFATLEKGFINLGVIDDTIQAKIRNKFLKLVEDSDYRELLFMNIQKYSFRENKQKVVSKIMELL